MNPLNKLRLLAGIGIDPSLEYTIASVIKEGNFTKSYLKEDHFKIGQMVEVNYKGEKSKRKVTRIEKDKKGNETYYVWCSKTKKEYPYKPGELKAVSESMEDSMEDSGPKEHFADGDIVFYDNGVYVVVSTDEEAEAVGIVPAGMLRSSQEEKNRSVQMVKHDKLRKPSQEEYEVFHSHSHSGNDSSAAKEVTNVGGMEFSLEGERIRESTQNYTKSNAVSFADKDLPVNVVAKDKTVNDLIEPRKNEAPEQLFTNVYNESNKIAVPSSVKAALKSLIAEFEKDEKSVPVSNQETRQFYLDSAAAYKQLLEYLDNGTTYDIKKAQIFATSLMGPMLHKIPNEVWKFLVNGGSARSLKAYVNELKTTD